MPVIPGFGKLRKENLKFEASLGYNPVSKTNTKNPPQKPNNRNKKNH
jgi:hypothetical protein